MSSRDLRRVVLQSTPRMRLFGRFAGLCIAGLLGGLVGCGSDATGPTPIVNVDQFWTLRLNEHAVTLALTPPANQLQLVATPLTQAGDVLVTDVKPTFTSSDSSVLVDSTGLLMAHSRKTNVKVVAKMTIRNVRGQLLTLVDTALINVNTVASVPVFTRFAITTPGDSAKFASFGSVTVGTLDATGQSIPGTLVYYDVSGAVQIGATGHFVGSWSSLYPGPATVYITANIYGVHKTDSLHVTMGWQTLGRIELRSDVVTQTVTVSAPALRLAVGGVAVFNNYLDKPIDISFDDPASASLVDSTSPDVFLYKLFDHGIIPTTSGNILLQPMNNTGFSDGVGVDARRFLQAGTYSWHSARYPTTAGTIIVQ